jgi:hypothetical protein
MLEDPQRPRASFFASEDTEIRGSEDLSYGGDGKHGCF